MNLLPYSRKIRKYLSIVRQVTILLLLQVTFLVNTLSNFLKRKAFSPGSVDYRELPVYYINLPERRKREDRTVTNLHRMGFRKMFKVEGVFEKIPKAGCALAHKRAFDLILNHHNKDKVVLVCEDDIKFIGQVEVLAKSIEEFVKNDNLKVLCIGNSNSKARRSLGDNLNEAYNIETASCYAVKVSFLPILKRNVEFCIEQLLETNGQSMPLDKFWKSLQVKYTFVIPKKKLVKQYSGKSDVEGRKIIQIK